MKTLIKLTNLKKVFSSDEVETHALSDINLEVKQGEYLSIAGPSGCGKSTLLSLLGLLDTSSGGNYNLNGHDVVDINGKQRAAIRNKEIGFVFQSFNLISELTVAENVALPLTYRKDLSKAERNELVTAALEKVDMGHSHQTLPVTTFWWTATTCCCCPRYCR